MNPFMEYRIPYVGLSIGSHAYEFRLTESFFALFEYSEIERGDILVEMELTRSSTMINLTFTFSGEAILPCDRCGTDLTVPVEGEEMLIVKFGLETGAIEDEVLILGSNEHEIDISQYLYEYAHLMLPSRRVHDTLEACDQDVIEQLEIEDENNDKNDPRWDALKGLK